MPGRSLLINLSILTAANIVSRGLGAVYRFFLARHVGGEGLGLIQMALSVYRFGHTLATLGIPTAVVKYTAENSVEGKEHKLSALWRCSALILGISTLAIGSLISILTPVISGRIMSDGRIKPMLLIAPLIMLISSFSSLVHSFYYGQSRIRETALVQLIEQTAKIILSLFAISIFRGGNISFIAAVIIISASVADLFGFSLLLSLFPLRGVKTNIFSNRTGVKRGLSAKKSPKASPYAKERMNPDTAVIVGGLFSTGIPVMLRGLLNTASHSLDAVIIPRCLIVSGVAPAKATELLGLFTGMAMPVIFLPGMLIFPLATVLLPEISADSVSREKHPMLKRKAKGILGLTFLISAAGAALLFRYSGFISMLLYRSTEPSEIISRLAISLPFFYTALLSGSILTALGRSGLLFVHSGVGIIVKTLLIILLTRIPGLGIFGTVTAFNVNSLVLALLNAGALYRAFKRL